MHKNHISALRRICVWRLGRLRDALLYHSAECRSAHAAAMPIISRQQLRDLGDYRDLVLAK